MQVKADSNGPGAPVKIEASITERVGGVRIGRSYSAIVGSDAFEYDPRLREATLAPPSPFSGRGTFRRAAAPGHRWTGDLTVDLPGRSGVRLSGGVFGAGLRHARWFAHEEPDSARISRNVVPWPSTKPWPTAFATSLPLGPS